MSAENSTNTTFATGWVDSPNGRGTLDIIWSCFFTIFVCTWTVLHLNLSDPDEPYWKIVLRKARWMTIAVLFPEVVTASAFVQRIAARKSVESMSELGHRWTMRHAFFLNMGGVWLQPKDSKAFPINAQQLEHLVANDYLDLPPLTEREIWDKSKADSFAKVVACGQIFWLVLQCVGRALQGLPITPLEIGTLGFAIPSLASFILWFHKPSNVEIATIIPISASTTELLERLAHRDGYSWRETPLDFISTVNSPSFTSEIILKIQGCPGREAFAGAATRIRNDVFGLKYSKLHQLVILMIWVGYGGIHFLAWDYLFPSRTEMVIWRVSCIVVAGSMLIFWVTSNRKAYLLVGLVWRRAESKMKAIAFEQKKVSLAQVLLGALFGSAYLIARMALIVEVFASLRLTPVGAFMTVNWTNFLPHI